MLLLPNPTPTHQRSSSASTLLRLRALDNINTASSEQGQSRAWKFWFLLPRMLLQRPPGVRMLSKDDWRTRIEHFQQGQWIYLGVVLNKSSQEPPFRKSFANLSRIFRLLSRSHQGCIFQNQEFASGIKYMESNKLEYKLCCCLHE